MTQQEVAEALGVDRGYVSLVETRAKARFKEELAKRGYKMEDFLGGMA
jgi:transcriptional regulator with XRE-family HTH domain